MREEAEMEATSFCLFDVLSIFLFFIKTEKYCYFAGSIGIPHALLCKIFNVLNRSNAHVLFKVLGKGALIIKTALFSHKGDTLSFLKIITGL